MRTMDKWCWLCRKVFSVYVNQTVCPGCRNQSLRSYY
jgi:Zn finger protein HypA/HybF involved in hydrogenase expression